MRLGLGLGSGLGLGLELGLGLRGVVLDEADGGRHEGVVDVRVDQRAVDLAGDALVEGDHARVDRGGALRRDVARAVAAIVADLQVGLGLGLGLGLG